MKTKLVLSILLLTLIFSFEKGRAQTPAWAWAKSASGPNEDVIWNVATDAYGNLYATGSFNLSITFGNIVLTSLGSHDIFLVKYDASGNVLWAKNAGGTSGDQSFNITTDIAGNVYITGSIGSNPSYFDSITLTGAISNEIFIAKYDSSGNAVWAKRSGGSNHDIGCGIAVDTIGNSYITGWFDSAVVTFDSITLTGSNGDIFIAKYNATGNVVWAKREGGTGSESGASIKVDANGNLYVTGNYSSPTITFGSTTLINTSVHGHIFLVKYDSSGNVLWARGSGGASGDYPYDMALDGSGNSYITGSFSSFAIYFGAITLVNSGGEDIFIVKYDSIGNAQWAVKAGGLLNDEGLRITVDKNENLYLTGNFYSDSISFSGNVLTNSGGFGSCDGFVAKYDSSGNIVWIKQIGGTATDLGNGVAVNSTGNVYVGGEFLSPTLNFGTTTLTNLGNTDIFIAKLDNTTGIADASTPLSMTSVFPNPATDYITINTNSNKKQLITITDITGQLIYSTTTLADKTIINTKDFPQGVYAVQVQAGDAVQTIKVVVTR